MAPSRLAALVVDLARSDRVINAAGAVMVVVFFRGERAYPWSGSVVGIGSAAGAEPGGGTARTAHGAICSRR